MSAWFYFKCLMRVLCHYYVTVAIESLLTRLLRNTKCGIEYSHSFFHCSCSGSEWIWGEEAKSVLSHPKVHVCTVQLEALSEWIWIQIQNETRGILFSTSNFKHKCFLSLPASEAPGASAEASRHSLCEAARCCAMGGVMFRIVWSEVCLSCL